MYLNSFVLTELPPVADAASFNVQFGSAIDGNFRVRGDPPWTIACGVHLELSAAPDDAGAFEIDLYAQPIRPDGTPYGNRALLRRRPLEVAEASEDWSSRRVYYDAYDAEFYVADEVDVDLVVEVDGEYAGERTIRLRRLDLPNVA